MFFGCGFTVIVHFKTLILELSISLDLGPDSPWSLVIPWHVLKEYNSHFYNMSALYPPAEYYTLVGNGIPYP